jgi:hypothetical protein
MRSQVPDGAAPSCDRLLSGRTYPKVAWILRALCAAAGGFCPPLVAAVAVAVAVSRPDLLGRVITSRHWGPSRVQDPTVGRAKEASANNPSTYRQFAALRQVGAYGLFRGELLVVVDRSDWADLARRPRPAIVTLRDWRYGARANRSIRREWRSRLMRRALRAECPALARVPGVADRGGRAAWVRGTPMIQGWCLSPA